MASGRCTLRKLKFPCPCLRGEFEAPLTTLDVECKNCAHPLSWHEDASSPLPQHEDASSARAPGSFQVYAKEAFKAGIKYTPPKPLVKTSGMNWVFQPHPDLYETLATNVLQHYAYYKSNNIDKTYIPTYFYVGGAGTGKSRHASEFVPSVQKAITLHTQHRFYHELAQRLKKAFVFHVSFANGTSLTAEERRDPFKAVGVRMLHQLLDEPIDHIRKRYDADPASIFRLLAAAEGVDLYEDFTGILVVDGIQKAKDIDFFGFLGQIAALSLMRRNCSKAEGLRIAPFIMTCVTATCFGPLDEFVTGSHCNRVFLPLNRLDAPTWMKDNSPVLNSSPITRLLVNDVGGHARAIELIADELANYQNGVQPNITELANAIYAKLGDSYSEAVSVLQRHMLPLVQCVLSRQQIFLSDVIPGSDLLWEHVTASGLIWFESTWTNYYAPGYLVAPYVWLWMLARLPPSKNTERLCQFLRTWKFNDYEELLHLATGEGLPGNITWQSFEIFCCSFRILRSLGFGDGQEVPLKSLHAGCKLRDDRKTIVVNRHLTFAEALHQYGTDSMAGTYADTVTSKAPSAEEVNTRHGGTLDAGAQLSHVILNGTSTPAGDFFFSIEMPAQRSRNGKSGQGKIVREVGQCKCIQKKLTQTAYNEERKRSAGPNDIFMLYTQTEISDDWALPDLSGIVDASCWDSYFGPFAGRAYIALQYSGSKVNDELR